MRTTVDIPDDLYRQAKAEAALSGRRLHDLVEEGLRRVLALPSGVPGEARVEFPLIHSRCPGALTMGGVYRAEDDALVAEDTSQMHQPK